MHIKIDFKIYIFNINMEKLNILEKYRSDTSSSFVSFTIPSKQELCI